MISDTKIGRRRHRWGTCPVGTTAESEDDTVTEKMRTELKRTASKLAKTKQ